MALLIRNQAAFAEQIARNDRERLRLERETRELERNATERFERIEKQLAAMHDTIVQDVLKVLPKIIVKEVLEKLPKAVSKEIGFKPQPT